MVLLPIVIKLFLYVLKFLAVHFMLLVKYLTKLRLNEFNFNELFFQQDGAPPHYALRVRDYLGKVFPQHWFGRRGSIEWPPCLPDLTPMISFFEGVVKNKVYEKNPKTVNELKDYILNAFKENDEDQNMCRTVCHSVLDRCEECCNAWRRTF